MSSGKRHAVASTGRDLARGEIEDLLCGRASREGEDDGGEGEEERAESRHLGRLVKGVVDGPYSRIVFVVVGFVFFNREINETDLSRRSTLA